MAKLGKKLRIYKAAVTLVFFLMAKSCRTQKQNYRGELVSLITPHSATGKRFADARELKRTLSFNLVDPRFG